MTTLVPASKTGHRQMPPPLSPRHSDDYPNIKYWHESAWNADLRRMQEVHKEGKGLGESEKPSRRPRAAPGESFKWNFLENSLGIAWTAKQGEDLRDRCRQIFQSMVLELGPEKLPTTWNAGIDLYWQRFLEHTLESEFDDLRLCEGHWKAHAAVIPTYSSWQQARRKTQERRSKREERLAVLGSTASSQPSLSAVRNYRIAS